MQSQMILVQLWPEIVRKRHRQSEVISAVTINDFMTSNQIWCLKMTEEIKSNITLVARDSRQNRTGMTTVSTF